MSTVRVPEDHPTLAEAVASGADEILISGEVEARLRIDRPLTLRGAGEGAVLHASEGRCLELHGDVVVEDLGIVNQGGTGIYVAAGSPRVSRVRMVVGNVAIACANDSTPVLREVTAERCAHGLLVEHRAAPDAELLTLVASGGGMVFRDEARGHLRQCAIVSGQMSAIEVGGSAAPVLEGIAVPQTAASALFVHGHAAPTVRELLVQQSRLASIELAGDSRATLETLSLAGSQGSGLFLRERAGGSFREITITGAALAAVEVAEEAAPTCEGLVIEGCQGSGLFFRGTAGGTWRGVQCTGVGKAGIEAAESADPTVDGATIVEPQGSGLFLHDRCRGTWMGLRLQHSALAAAEIAGHAAPELEDVEVFGSQQGGLWVHDQARAEIIGLKVRHTLLAAIEVAEAGRLRVEEAEVRDTRGMALRVIEEAQLQAERLELCEGEVELADDCRVTWTGGRAAGPVRVSGRAVVRLVGVEAPDVQTHGKGTVERR